jgi:hypothetical protein
VQTEFVDLLLSINPNCGLTLGEGRTINPITMDGKIRHYLNCVQRRQLGRRWSELSAASRLTAIGFRERGLDHGHWHLMVAASPDVALALSISRDIWAKVRPAGDWWFGFLEKEAAYASYITKELYTAETQNNVFIYTPR